MYAEGCLDFIFKRREYKGRQDRRSKRKERLKEYIEGVKNERNE